MNTAPVFDYDHDPNNIPPIVRGILAEALEGLLEGLRTDVLADPTFADRKATRRAALRDETMKEILAIREIAKFIGYDLTTTEDARAHVYTCDPDTDEETTEELSWAELLDRHEATILADIESQRRKAERDALLADRRALDAKIKAMANK